MNILNGQYFCFDDVLLVPQYSEIESRALVDTSTSIAGIYLKVPMISSNMGSVTEEKMAEAMFDCGGLGILHRYAPLEEIERMLTDLNEKKVPAIPSVGVTDNDKWFIEHLDKVRIKVSTVCIDIAHGHAKKVIEMIMFLKRLAFTVIAGNIATEQGAKSLVAAGADVIKVGIGPGSLCTTRVVTGHGIPQLSAIIEVSKIKDDYPNIQIIADGGIRNSGDIVKALAAGADGVMIGRLFAGCKETPGEIIKGKKVYRGSASFGAQILKNGCVHGTPEGEACLVDAKGSVKEVVSLLAGGIRSGLSYSGCSSIKELQENAVFIRVSDHTYRENLTY
jgi:IMP dehydrogenase